MKRMLVLLLTVLLVTVVSAGSVKMLSSPPTEEPYNPPTDDFPPGQGEDHASDQGREHGQAFEEGWNPPGQTKPKGIPFTTIDKGFLSYYKWQNMSFTGEYKVISDEEDWEDFWDTHTSGISPQPDVPDVNFNSRMVLVALQGFRRNCCGYYINFTKIEQNGTSLDAFVHKTENPGPLQMTTNPYHIIEVKKAQSVNFIEV